MVVVNLYPFAATIAKPGVTVEEARANIDIGGPCMVRASAKNYLRVASVTDPADYPKIAARLEATGGVLSLEDRYTLAKKAFAHTAAYDAAIAKYLGERTSAEVGGCYNFKG
jgi:phosphoribosylaminoimidazolecarboxamide formyltransferase/IMP cyclohydrolase